MKNFWMVCSRFLVAFFFTFGVFEFLFFIRGLFPHFGGLVGATLFQTLLCMVASLILTISHTVVSSEFLDQYVTVKSRAIVCSIPCIITLGTLTVYYGIPSLIVLLLGLKSELVATTTWAISFVFCLMAIVLLYWLVERNFRNTGKKYDVALAAYKKKAEG